MDRAFVDIFRRFWMAVELDEGPLIFRDNEAWQDELNTTCRRLRRYLEKGN